MGEADGLSLPFINFNVPALAPRLLCGETVLELHKNITFFAIRGIQAHIIGKGG
jgi:hypothetical protein